MTADSPILVPTRLVATADMRDSVAFDPSQTGQIEFLTPGAHSVTLSHIPNSCQPPADNPRTVDVPEGGQVQVEFHLECGSLFRNQILFRDIWELGTGPAVNYDLGVVNPDGTGEIRLTSDNDPQWFGTVSPARDAFVYSTTRQNTGVIVVQHLDGRAPVEIVPSGVAPFDPVVSSDGQTIAFLGCGTPSVASGVCQNGGQPDLYTVGLDGQGLTQVTESPARESVPDWSPDGTELVFAARLGSDSRLYRVNIDGTGLREIATPLPAYAPSWSTDGSAVAYLSDRPGRLGDHDLWVVSLGTGAATQVTSSTTVRDRPTWSPDGTRIAISLHVNGTTPGIHTLNPDGTDIRLVKSVDAALPDWSRE